MTATTQAAATRAVTHVGAPGPAAAPKKATALPDSPAVFDSNNAFADLDTTMAKAVATLSVAVKRAPFNGSITDAQLKELAAGKLNGAAAPASLADLGNVAKLLGSPEGQAYKKQLGSPVTTATLLEASKTGFAPAHAALLQSHVGAYAAALNGPLKSVAGRAPLTQNQLRSLFVGGGNIGGKKLADFIPDAAAREAFLGGAALLLDNRRLFQTVGSMSGQQLQDVLAGKAVPVKNANANWKVKLDDAVSATMPVKPAPQPTVDVHDPRWKTKLPVLISEYGAFMKSEEMVAFHEAWHRTNGSGGTRGKGSGEWFLQFHAQMAGSFLEFLKKRGKSDAALVDGQLPNWADMTKALPDVMFPNPTASKNINWKVPAFLSRKGAAADGATVTLDGKTIRSLDDIKTMDDLGRVMGESGAHAVAHVQLGGAMASFKSVAEPAFITWHYGTIEKIRHQWLETANGKKWAAANPMGWTKPFVDSHDEVMQDVVDRIVRSRSQSWGEGPAAAVRGRAGAAPAPATKSRAETAQLIREARLDAEEQCIRTSSPDTVFFTAGEIGAAAAGFQDPALRKAGIARARSKAAAPRTAPWGQAGTP